jgi:integrase
MNGENMALWEGKYLKLHLRERRGEQTYVIRYMDKKTNTEKMRQVPKGREPIAWAQKQDIKLKYNGTLDKEQSSLLVDLITLYKAEIDERVENFKSDSKYGRRLRPNRRTTLLVHINKHILPHFGNMDIEDITTQNVMKFQKELEKRMSPQYANTIVGTLRRIFKFFRQESLVQHNPCVDLDPLETRESQERYTPTEEEVLAILNVTGVHWKKVMIKLAAANGMRISEILALRWDAIDGDKIHIRLSNDRGELGDTKTAGSNRIVRISKDLKDDLAQLKSVSDSQWLFTNAKANLFAASDVLKSVLHKACVKANVKKFGFHGLRRFYINKLLNENKSKDHVQVLVGHKVGSDVTDKHYRQIRPEDVYKDEYIITLH